MQNAPEPFFNLENFVSDLREQFNEAGFDPSKLLHVAIQVKNPEENPTPVPSSGDRSVICVASGNQVCIWKVESLRGLFRGDKKPPVLGDYPEAYNSEFMLLEMHLLEFCKLFGDRRDAEMREIYSALRRRPDGRSLGFLHDFMWQAAALVLGTRPLSQAEFEAIMERLERSCRTFEQGPTSRNYVTTIKTSLGQAGV